MIKQFKSMRTSNRQLVSQFDVLDIAYSNKTEVLAISGDSILNYKLFTDCHNRNFAPLNIIISMNEKSQLCCRFFGLPLYVEWVVQFKRMLESLIDQTEFYRPPAPLWIGDFKLIKDPKYPETQKKLEKAFGTGKNIQDIYPLTPLQEGILFHILYSPHSGQYFEQMKWKIEGNNFDSLALKKTWEHIIQRHDSFRTCFVWELFSSSHQIVLKKVKVPWRELVWCGLEERLSPYSNSTFFSDDISRGFNEISQAPLMRFYVIWTSKTEVCFVWDSSHLLYDGWSLPIVIKEMEQLYGIYRKNDVEKLKLLKPVIHPFKNYISWLQEQDMSEVRLFWKKVLYGFDSPTILPKAKETPDPTDMDDQMTEKMTLSRTTLDCIKSLAKRHQLTLNTIVQGTWALVLSHLTGACDVLFGSTVSGRSISLNGIEEMVGLFINAIPVRVKVNKNDRIFPWLHNLQIQQIKARQYEFAPLNEIQKWSDIPKGASLFESLVVFENYPIERKNEKTDEEHSNTQTVTLDEKTNYHITVVADPEMTVFIKYKARFFSQPYVKNIHDLFKNILSYLGQLYFSKIQEQTQQRIIDIDIIGNHQRHQVVIEWNDTKHNILPKEENHLPFVHCLFESQSKAKPDSIALIFDDEQITYRELDYRSDQISGCLKRAGVGSEQFLAVCLERSIELIVCIIGVFKSGAAYVPIDPGYPIDRQSLMLASANFYICSANYPIQNYNDPRSFVFMYHDIWRNNFRKTVDRICGLNAAYLTFTSGSTGIPKAVCSNHQAFYHQIVWGSQQCTQMCKLDRIIQKTSICFDISLWEQFTSIITGGALVILPPSSEKDPESIQMCLIDQCITSAFFVPSMLNSLLENLSQLIDYHSLKYVVVGGEALPAQVIQKFFASKKAAKLPCFNNTTLKNLYGPTEATIYCSGEKCMPSSNTGTTSIGTPVSNIDLFIGNDSELLISGITLARGYLKKGAATAEKFIPNELASASRKSINSSKHDPP